MSNDGDLLLDLEVRLARELLILNYPSPVEYVYNPIDYAYETHADFVYKYACYGPKPVLFLGMNPGPWGMAQTGRRQVLAQLWEVRHYSISGVPFGEVSYVKDWLAVKGNIGKPTVEHPKRQVDGFRCKRREVSGERFWAFLKSLCGLPQTFATNCLVYNHCPLVLLSKTGKNVTPPELNSETRKRINTLCDEALKSVIEMYRVKHIVGLGRFAEGRARQIVADNHITNVKVHFMVHPSPASAMANRGWDSLALKALEQAGLVDLVKGTSLVSTSS
jgi:single-strand selective monofunctional uracil DNA glycosylase